MFAVVWNDAQTEEHGVWGIYPTHEQATSASAEPISADGEEDYTVMVCDLDTPEGQHVLALYQAA